MLKLMEKSMRVNGLVHAGALLVAFGAFQAIKGKLDTSYAASNHPVDYATGQTAFSAEITKGYYAHMQNAGTLDVYVQTQLIDFGFIATMFVLGFLLSTFIARFTQQASWGRKAALFSGLLIMLGALFDIAENLTSLIMLADPQGFADWIALPYSGFAVVKFGLIASGMLGLVFAVLLLGFAALRRKLA